ncbi:MAG: 30S ribosomal protein S19e [Candidatus Woesearchaeota archaeon]
MIYQVSQQKLVLALAQELKSLIEMPEWARFVKTGPHRETLPKNPDWWYIRAASILRTCYKNGPVGVSKLRTRYGGRKNRGFRPDKFERSSGKIIRTILQQLESAELIKQDAVGVHKGRVATAKGTSLLAKSAKQVAETAQGDN